jgi:CsoR family transcriptional regulator, copper-sensing transcriptional repressor
VTAPEPAPPAVRRSGSYQASKEELAKRFRRVIGQICGIAQMVEDERYCPEVLTQLSAAAAALDKIGYILLHDHVRHCVAEGIERGEGDAYMEELMTVIQRFTGR